MLSISGCSSVEFDELVAGSAGVAGCGIGTAVAGPAGCAVGGGSAVVITSVSTPPSQVDISSVDNEYQADVLKDEHRWAAIKEFGIYIAGFCLLFLLLDSPISRLFRRKT